MKNIAKPNYVMTGPKSGKQHICRTFQNFQKRHDGSYRNQFFSRDFEGHREDFGQEKVVLDQGRSEHFNRALSPDGGLRCCFPAGLLGVPANSEIYWPKSLPASSQTSTRTMMISGNPIQSNLHDWWHLSPFVNVKLLPWSKNSII